MVPPPWAPELFAVHWTTLPDSKRHCTQDILQRLALASIVGAEGPGCVPYYTDGSRDPVAGRTAAGMFHSNLTAGWRLPDHCTILQAELFAIQQALQHALADHQHPPIIHVDSKAAIQALMHREPKDNIHLITSIWGDMQTLMAPGRRATINWIPSHVGIPGNDAADEAARTATLEAQPRAAISISLSQIALWAAGAARRPFPDPGDSRSLCWYVRATHRAPPPSIRTQSRELRVHIHRLPLGYPTTARIVERAREELCAHCDRMVPKPLVHYLLDCPATMPLRRRHFPMTPVGQAREDKAAHLVYLTVRDLETLLPVIARHLLPPPKVAARACFGPPLHCTPAAVSAH